MFKTKKIFFIVYFFLLQISVFAHPFYTSICQVEFNNKGHSLEISVKVFADDLIRALEKKGASELFLGEKKEIPQTDSLINAYIQSKYSFVVNSQKTIYNFIGKEMDTDAVWCYFEIENVKDLKQIEVHCDLLTELFDSQINIIPVAKNEVTRNILLDKGKTVDSLNFE